MRQCIPTQACQGIQPIAPLPAHDTRPRTGAAHWRSGACAIIAALLAACSSVMPGADYPKAHSVALADPQTTRLGERFTRDAREHGGRSGFRIVSNGVDAFLIRAQMIDAAQRTLDLQYFIFRGDQTGRLLTDALRRAAARGVRVRVLVDDGDTVAGDEQILALDGQANLEVRVFNPFAYRGHNDALRGLEFLANASRLDYRMHNKLMVADDSVALVGGRNIGNQYFQMDPQSQLADDDVFAAGPIAERLAATFDEYWNSRFAIPARALARAGRPARARTTISRRRRQRSQMDSLASPGIDYVAKIASGEPYRDMISGRLPLVWAHAQVVCDSPEKKRIRRRERVGQLMQPDVAVAAAMVHSELLMITPYVVPAPEEMKLLADLRRRGVKIRILTNSLMTARSLLAQSGYMHYRVPLLVDGVQLYEIRAQLGNTRGSGQTERMSRFGTYSLHAKQFIFDRQRVFFGSMNFDRRSRDLNTEVGVIIDSAQLAAQAAARFEAMAAPANAYAVRLRTPAPGSGPRGKPQLVWDTTEAGVAVTYEREPVQSAGRRLRVKMLSLLQVDSEL